jgi:hypothetical protein
MQIKRNSLRTLFRTGLRKNNISKQSSNNTIVKLTKIKKLDYDKDSTEIGDDYE